MTSLESANCRYARTDRPGAFRTTSTCTEPGRSSRPRHHLTTTSQSREPSPGSLARNVIVYHNRSWNGRLPRAQSFEGGPASSPVMRLPRQLARSGNVGARPPPAGERAQRIGNMGREFRAASRPTRGLFLLPQPRPRRAAQACRHPPASAPQAPRPWCHPEMSRSS